MRKEVDAAEPLGEDVGDEFAIGDRVGVAWLRRSPGSSNSWRAIA